MVKYKDNNGKNELKKFANNGKIDVDIPTFKMAAIKSKRKKIKAMNNHPLIEYIGFDKTLTKLGWPSSESAGDAVTGNSNKVVDEQLHYLRRHLAEDGYNEMYGLRHVQADQLQQGTAKNVNICVIDTGYARDHPDLPSAGVIGFNPYSSGTWYTDVDGHGSHCAGM